MRARQLPWLSEEGLEQPDVGERLLRVLLDFIVGRRVCWHVDDGRLDLLLCGVEIKLLFAVLFYDAGSLGHCFLLGSSGAVCMWSGKHIVKLLVHIESWSILQDRARTSVRAPSFEFLERLSLHARHQESNRFPGKIC
jgi:hypothetical protein